MLSSNRESLKAPYYPSRFSMRRPHTAGLFFFVGGQFHCNCLSSRCRGSHCNHDQSCCGYGDVGRREVAAVLCSENNSDVFTPETQQGRFHPLIPVDGDLLPLDLTPKIFGVSFDPHFHFHKHVGAIEEKAKQGLSLLKAPPRTTWGQQKETVIVTYKARIDSIFSYASPIWYPNDSKTTIKNLQLIQLSAIRVATGSLMMSSIDHLHMEAEIMTVREHLDMLSTQALATYLQEGHPSFSMVRAYSGPRDKKQTLQRRFNHKVPAYTN